MTMIDIKSIREQHGLTQQDVADKLFISLRTYQRMEKTPENLTQLDIKNIFSIFGMDYINENNSSKFPMKKIPFYKSFKASAGFGAINGDVEEPEYIIMPGHFLPDASCHTEAIECSGDSMSPAINNGDTMFIDRADTEIRDGEIYVIRCFEELFVKRLFKMPGKIMARSDNATAGYSEFPLDLSNCQVLGRVLYRMERV